MIAGDLKVVQKHYCNFVFKMNKIILLTDYFNTVYKHTEFTKVHKTQCCGATQPIQKKKIKQFLKHVDFALGSCYFQDLSMSEWLCNVKT